MVVPDTNTLTQEQEDKIRRRIKRFIRTGESQARVEQISKRIFEYKLIHHVKSIYYRRTFFGGLREVSQMKHY